MKIFKMRYLILFALIFIGYGSIAQEKTKKHIFLNKGQKINVVNTISSDADMGMGMQMKTNMVSNGILSVTGENEKEYTLTNTLTRMKGTMDVMGKTHDFDSENESDRNSEIGKSLSASLGKSDSVVVNKFSGMVAFEKKDTSLDKSEPNPMEDMIKAFGNDGDNTSITGAFLIIPAGKKAGDSWTETDSSKEKKSVIKYTINSISNGTATVSFQTTMDNTSMVEVQGSQMNVSINTKSKGEILSNIKTGLVNKRIIDSDISGTIDIMGQSMPITAKNSLTSLFTLSE